MAAHLSADDAPAPGVIDTHEGEDVTHVSERATRFVLSAGCKIVKIVTAAHEAADQVGAYDVTVDDWGAN
jgi:hypothetical protein